jgi:hypothetical protein
MKGLMQPVDFTRFFRAVGRVVTGIARRVTGRRPSYQKAAGLSE